MSNAHIIAGELADRLGEGWELDTDREVRWRTHIVGPDGIGLYVATDTYGIPEGKVRISPVWPRAFHDVTHYDETLTKHINATVSRGYEAVTREVERRLLPAYREQFNELAERVAARDEQAARAAAARDALAVALRGSTDEHREPRGIRFGMGRRDYCGSADVSHDGSTVQIEFRSVPIELAHRIAGVLAEYDAEQGVR